MIIAVRSQERVEMPQNGQCDADWVSVVEVVVLLVVIGVFGWAVSS